MFPLLGAFGHMRFFRVPLLTLPQHSLLSRIGLASSVIGFYLKSSDLGLFKFF